MVGRPTKCTPEMIDRICSHLENGINIKTTCELVGIDESTFSRWRNRGQSAIEEFGDDPEAIPESEMPFCRFCKRIKRARAKAKATSLKAIRDAGDKGSWKAHAWYLERSFSDEFSKKSNLDITTKGEPVTDPLAGMSTEERKRALRRRLQLLETDERIPDDPSELEGLPGD